MGESADIRAINNRRGRVFVWNRSSNSTWALQAKLTINNSDQFQVGMSLTMSRDGRTLVAGSMKGVFMWTLSSTGVWALMTSGRQMLKNSTQGGYVALSSDGRTLAAAAGQKVEIWAYSDNRIWMRKRVAQPQLQSPEVSFLSVALSNNGNTLAIGCIGFGRLEDHVQMMGLSANGTWVSVGPQVVSTPRAIATAAFGSVMALSGSGLTLAVGNTVESNTGATYVFKAGA